MIENNELSCMNQENMQINQMIGTALREIMAPLMKSMADCMQRNTEALDRLASTQKVQADRIEALEKQIRLNTPVTPAQVKYFDEAIRKKARETLAKYELDGDKKSVTKLRGIIKKAIMSRCGVSQMGDIPRHEYSIILNQINGWTDVLSVKDVVKEARERLSKEA